MLGLETAQLVSEREWRATWLRLVGAGITAQRPKANRARRPLVSAPRPRRVPAIRYRYHAGEIAHR